MDWLGDPALIPKEAGAYLLWIELDEPTDLPPVFGGCLASGTYLYAGSAYGPGGMRSRCTRHISRQKSKRWHVDWLTTVARDVCALPVVGGNECALIAMLGSQGLGWPPVPGFGSSDCRSCRSHLFSVEENVNKPTISRAVQSL
ncbi:MAG: GIY-YIG nuclease family protein [Candidatus Thalassarchaeaceae archaeon]|nr:GIY-YIG nuclease family protein [Candidatus Thalassarchaeaceae archaeon]